MLGASAQAMEPMMNTTMPTSMMVRRPWESLSLP
jgi:hypothetical protein